MARQHLPHLPLVLLLLFLILFRILFFSLFLSLFQHLPLILLLVALLPLLLLLLLCLLPLPQRCRIRRSVPRVLLQRVLAHLLVCAVTSDLVFQ